MFDFQKICKKKKIEKKNKRNEKSKGSSEFFLLVDCNRKVEGKKFNC